MRKRPQAPPPSLDSITPPEGIKQGSDSVVTQVRQYTLITPLYGGGVDTTQADEITVVRATEIRGQLRFWWRACKGGKFNGDLAAMKQEEDAIWGKAYKKGDIPVPHAQTVQISIDTDSLGRGRSIKPFDMVGGKPRKNNEANIPLYAVFPLFPDQKQKNLQIQAIPIVQVNVSFTMNITFPEERRKDIEAALWAWETFGGVGARTRRGFGALQLIKVDNKNAVHPSASNVEQWLHQKLTHPDIVERGLFPANVPHLSSNTSFAIVSYGSPMDVWNKLINKLRDFRQAKNGNRSAWPEAEAIRTILREENISSAQTFPRAALGLPIIFQFTGNNAPKNTALREKDEDKGLKDRFASPLILRPLLCSDNKAVGLALLLEGSRVNAQNLSLVEQEGDKKAHPVKATLSKEEAKSIPILKGETDILRALMKFFRGE